MQYNLQILHYNHKVRGEASYQDEQFVRELADKYKLKLHVRRLSGKPVKNSETYLREHRLKFFQEILSKNPYSVIATGHNLDDNIETFVMRWAKGSRLRGLLAIHSKQGQFIRPLLNVSRQEIQTYAQKYNIMFRQDVTNYDTNIIRNKIRHEIIPYLKRELNMDISKNITKMIKDFQEYNRIYEQKLMEVILSATKKTKDGILLNRKRYQLSSTAIRRGLIEYCIFFYHNMLLVLGCVLLDIHSTLTIVP